MIRGTTPLLTFTLPFDVSYAPKVWVTFSQSNIEVFTIEKDALEITENIIKCKLTQKQTLSLCVKCKVEIQIRVLDADGNSLASEIMEDVVERILKGGEIS